MGPFSEFTSRIITLRQQKVIAELFLIDDFAPTGLIGIFCAGTTINMALLRSWKEQNDKTLSSEGVAVLSTRPPQRPRRSGQHRAGARRSAFYKSMTILHGRLEPVPTPWQLRLIRAYGAIWV
jgi:hypothetical protein